MALHNAALMNIIGSVTLARGRGHLRLSADALGGRLSLEANTLIDELGELTPEQWKNVNELPVNAAASLTELKLHNLWPILGQQNTLRPLNGVVNATIERGDAERQQKTIANVGVTLRDLRWESTLWSRQLRARIVIGQHSLELRELSGPLAGGRLTGRGKVALDASRNGSFELSASRVALAKLLVPIDPSGDLADGLVSLRVQGRLGRRLSGRGFVSMDRGEVGPISFAIAGTGRLVT